MSDVPDANAVPEDPAGGDLDLGALDVAVAHWGTNSPGGAETVVAEMAAVLDADRVYTMGSPDDSVREAVSVPLYDVLENRPLGSLRRLQARADRLFEYALWEDVDWREYGPPDVLVTSGATTRAVITPASTLHVNYCHSPPRWLYDRYHDRIGDLPVPVAAAARPVLRHLRTRDAAVDARVDTYLANSPVIARRLWKFYDREATVIYPPVDVDAFDPAGVGEYYLHVGRLDAEKGVAEAVAAFADLDARLVLLGPEGDDTERVRAMIRRLSNVEYRGFVSVAEKRSLYEGARAVVFNGVAEDFGIVPVESLAAGTACLARDEGFPGMLIDAETGGLHDGSPAGIHAAVENFEDEPFVVDAAHARPFAREHFVERLRAAIVNEYQAFDARFRA